MIPNCPVTLDDIKNANKSFAPDFHPLKVKMARRQPKNVLSNYIKIPKNILQLQNMVLVAADIMFVNGMEFIARFSRHVKYTTLQHLLKRVTGNISKYLEKINDV